MEIPNFGNHVLDFLETIFAVWFWLGGVHFVRTKDNLLNTEEMEQSGVLMGLSLDFSLLVVSLLDQGFDTTLVGWNHEKSNLTKPSLFFDEKFSFNSVFLRSISRSTGTICHIIIPPFQGRTTPLSRGFLLSFYFLYNMCIKIFSRLRRTPLSRGLLNNR